MRAGGHLVEENYIVMASQFAVDKLVKCKVVIKEIPNFVTEKSYICMFSDCCMNCEC